MEDIVLRNEYKVLQKSVVDCSKSCVIVTVLDLTLELFSQSISLCYVPHMSDWTASLSRCKMEPVYVRLSSSELWRAETWH